MIHAGGFTTLMLAVLDGMVGFAPDCLLDDSVSNVTMKTSDGEQCPELLNCLLDDSVSNVTTKASDGEQCPELLNCTTQHCQCCYATVNRTHRLTQAARNSSISFANTEDLQDLEQAVLLVKEVLNTLGHIKNCTSALNSCLPLYEQRKNYTDTHHELQVLLGMARTTQNIVWYYMPPLITLVFLCGMIGNVTLLYIFYRHPDTRSGPKILLISLAVSDVLLLLFNFFGKYYFRLFPFTLGRTMCHIYTFLVVIPPRASILTIMVLSITRYIAVTAMPGDRSHKLLDRMPLAITLVWTAASLEAIQPSLDSVIIKYDFSDKTHCDIRPSMATVMVHITVTCFMPFAIIGFFTWATYRQLRGAAQKTSAKSEVDMAKERNVKILPALTLCFTVTYPPFYLFWLMAAIHKFTLSSTIVWFYYMVQFLLNINSALNPLVLYLSSGMFREYFDMYLRIGCKKVQEQQEDKPGSTSDQIASMPCE